MKLHLRPVGKPAPPRPRSALFFTSRDHLVGRDLARQELLQRLVAAARDVVGEPPVAAREPGHQDGVRAVVEEFAGAFIRPPRLLLRDPGGAFAALRGGAQLVDQPVERGRRHPDAHALVVDQQHRRVAAGAHALAFLEREARRRAWSRRSRRPSFALQVPAAAVAPCSAHGRLVQTVSLKRPVGCEVVHRVEGGDLVHRHRRHAEVARHGIHHRDGEPAVLVLRDRERGHHRRLLLVGGVLGDLAVDPGLGVDGKHQRSILPKTMSCVPMMATTSAIMCPRDISSSAARCT